MGTTVVTTDGTYTGRTLASVIRREYGRTADLHHTGLIVRRVGVNQMSVLGKVLRWDGISGYPEREQEVCAEDLPSDDEYDDEC